MGAFFLFRRSKRPSDDSLLWTSVATLRRQGFARPEFVGFGDYFISLFPRRQEQEVRLKRYKGGDFIALIGTIVFQGRRDADALDPLYRSIDHDTHALDDAIGHFTLIVGRAGELRVIGDRAGAATIFHAPGVEAVSSSFLALASVTPKLTLQRQSVYEFVLNGAITGDDTLALEIARVSRQAIVSATAQGVRVETVPQLRLGVDTRPRQEMLMESHHRLAAWFDNVAAVYGDNISCALTAGYDSRLILSHLLMRGIKPKALVYRDGGGNAEVAQALAKAVDVPLDVIDPSRLQEIGVGDFAGSLVDNFYKSDGYSYQGLFNNNVEDSERLRRTAGGHVFLHGGGGEIFRDFFQLSDRPVSVQALVRAFFAKFDQSVCTPAFVFRRYVDNVVAKIQALIGDQREMLDRQLVEWLYPNFRCRAWFGRDSSLCNRAGAHLLPFYELPITNHASRIPVAYKRWGSYEAELINLASAKAAGVTSQYGHSFVGEVPLLRRVKDQSKIMLPPSLRPLAFQLRQRHKASRQAPSTYLSEPFVREALPGKMICVGELFDVEKVREPSQRSRLLSVEYLARHFGSKAALEGRAVEFESRRGALATLAWKRAQVF